MMDVWTYPPEVAVAVVVIVVVIALAGAVIVRRRRRRVGRAEAPRSQPAAAPARAVTPTGVESATERLWRGLAKTRQGFMARLAPVLQRRHVDAEAIDTLEVALLGADVGTGMTERLVRGLRARGDGAGESVRQHLAREMVGILEAAGGSTRRQATTPWVIMVVGVNGVGKTTSIGKLAGRYVAEGKKVLLVAADTFRAAAMEQLAVWADRTRADMIRQQQGSDPGALAYDGVRAAIARGVDVVIVDTAGRLHTKSNLMEEIRKVRRILARELPGAPHETLLVLDAVTGQNGVAQARAFAQALEVTGVILTKLDGTAKGGVVLAIAGDLGVPVRYVGIGEGVDDLREFDPRQFVAALLGDQEEQDSLDT